MAKRTRIKKGARNALRTARLDLPKKQPKRKPMKQPRQLDAERVRLFGTFASEEADKVAAKLENLVWSLDLQHLVEFCMREEMMQNFNDYKESRDTGRQSAVEHLVQLRLKKSDVGGGKITDPNSFPDFKRAVDLAEEAMLLEVWTAATPEIKEDGSLRAQTEQELEADSLVSRIKSMQLAVRSPAYYHFGWEVLIGLFQPFGAELTSLFGVTIEQLQTFVEGGSAATAESNEAVSKFARSVLEIGDDQVEALARGEAVAFPPHICESLLSLPKDQRKQAVRNDLCSALLEDSGCSFKFTPVQISKLSGLDEPIVRSLLDQFSLNAGGVSESYRRPKGDGPLRTRPIVHLDDGLYVIPAPYLLTWCIQERLEDVLEAAVPNSSRAKRAWHRYEKHRAKYLESSALRWIGEVLKGSTIYHTLTYKALVDDELVGTELDGLVLYQSHAILIEAKAGSIGTKARDGKASSIANRIGRLIGDSHKQVERAVQFILNNEKPKFECDGQTIEIDKDRFWSIVPITVSLEGLQGVAASYGTVVKAGFGPDTVVPWAVPYFDLRAICDLVESPSTFLAFVRERIRMPKDSPFETYDELGWFATFIKRGLQPSPEEFGKADHVIVSGSVEEVDDYFHAQMGIRSVETKKPRLEGKPQFLKIFEELEEMPNHESSWIASRFLACPNSWRQDIAQYVDLLRARARADSKPHDVSVPYEDGGLTVFSCLSKDLEVTKRIALSLAEGKKHQFRRLWWLVIVTCADQDSYVGAAGFLRYPYQFNQAIDERIRRLPSAALKISDPRRDRPDAFGLD